MAATISPNPYGILDLAHGIRRASVRRSVGGSRPVWCAMPGVGGGGVAGMVQVMMGVCRAALGVQDAVREAGATTASRFSVSGNLLWGGD